MCAGKFAKLIFRALIWILRHKARAESLRRGQEGAPYRCSTCVEVSSFFACRPLLACPEWANHPPSQRSRTCLCYANFAVLARSHNRLGSVWRATKPPFAGNRFRHTTHLRSNSFCSPQSDRLWTQIRVASNPTRLTAVSFNCPSKVGSEDAKTWETTVVYPNRSP
jgi:hypothetical protein